MLFSCTQNSLTYPEEKSIAETGVLTCTPLDPAPEREPTILNVYSNNIITAYILEDIVLPSNKCGGHRVGG